MTTLTALIADDEPLARARLHRLLLALDVQVLGEAANAARGLELARDLKPDLLLLDIQMPGVSGLEAGKAMPLLPDPPLLVFVTGYSEHAVAAFDQAALDYLVKPVTADRLAVTLARARERLADRQARRESNPPAPEPVEALRTLPVRGDYAVRFLMVSAILCVTARQKRVFVRTEAGEYRTHYTLTQLETLLPPEDFLRIHDSALVHLQAVTELLFLGDHAYEVRLKNDQRLRVGRTRYAELKRRLGMHRPDVG